MRQIRTRSNAIAYVCGVLHGDGWCTARGLGLRVKDQDFANAFADAMEIITNGPVRSRLDERGYWFIRVRYKDCRFNFIKDFVPNTSAHRSLWLRGMFDSEGNAQLSLSGKRGGNCYSRRISMYSTNLSTLTAAADRLQHLNIPNTIRATKNSSSHIGTKTVYELAVKAGKENYARFATLVGSSIARKRVTLAAIVSSYVSDFSASCRKAQRKGAKAKRAKSIRETLPRVVRGVRDLIDMGIKPTQRACRQIPGFNTIQGFMPQAKLIEMARRPVNL